MFIPNALMSLFSRLSRMLQPGAVAVFDMVLESYASFGLSLVAELGIADLLLAGPRSIGTIAQHCQADPEALYRLMRALASRGVFREGKGRVFRNTAMSRGLAEGPGSMKYMVISHLNPQVLAMFGELRHSIMTGQSAARHLWHQDVFSLLESNPSDNYNFIRAMDNSSALSSPIIIAALDLSQAKCIVDIGGGLGGMLTAILANNKKLTGILFERPETVAEARGIVSKSEVGQRIQCIAGDFFTDPLPPGDIYFLKNIIHDWDDRDAIRILSKIRAVIPQEGLVILVDFVIPGGNAPYSGKYFDLLMLTGLDGARERNSAEFAQLFKLSGFSLSKLKRTIAPFSVIEGRPI